LTFGGINPCPKSLQNGFFSFQTLGFTLRTRKILKLLFNLEELVTEGNALAWEGRFRTMYIFRKGIYEFPSKMRPTEASCNIRNLCVPRIGSGVKIPFKSLKELLRIFATSTRLV